MNIEQLITCINKNVQLKKIDKKYEDRMKRFFPIYDMNNCERTYYMII